MESEGREFLKALQRCADPADFPALHQACAGRTVYLTERPPSPRHWLSLAIGTDKAVALFKKLVKQDEYFPGEIEVPFVGKGLMATVQEAVTRRIEKGFREGKSLKLIGVECGITARAVRLRKAALRESGALPPIPAEVAALSKFFADPSSVVVSRLRVTDLEDVAEKDTNHFATGTSSSASILSSLSQLRLSAPALAEKCREARALAEIETCYGRLAHEKVLAAARGKTVSLSRVALEKSDHPFRAALDQVEAKLIPVKLKLAGDSMAHLVFPRAPTDAEIAAQKLKAEIEALLLRGQSPPVVARDLACSLRVVQAMRYELVRKGTLPPHSRGTGSTKKDQRNG